MTLPGLPSAVRSGMGPQGQRSRFAKPQPYLAFVFGTVFCGVLAYAALRDRPITDPGQFFILRVLTALSAAAVAAMIPGFLDINVRRNALFGIRAGGALAVLTLVYLVDPSTKIRPELEAQVASMFQNYSNGLYDDAERVADRILEKAPKAHAALNVKGGIAYYKRNYSGAVEHFENAVKAKNDPVYVSNLAYAYTEVGGYQRAIQLLDGINDGKPDWSYSMGRAQLYAGSYGKAITYLEPVPTTFWKGAARILEAAALVGRAQEETNPDARNKLRLEAERKFLEGYRFDRDYWRGILTEQSFDIHQGYAKAVGLLRDMTRVHVKPTS